MSGAFSIPFTFMSLFLPSGYAKEIFAILAYLTLWVMAFKIGWKNYQLIIERTSLKPLKLSSLAPRRLSPEGHWQYGLELEVFNPNQSVSGVKLKIISVEPPFFNWAPGLGKSNDLDGIDFYGMSFSSRMLNQNEKSRVLICHALLAGEVQLEFHTALDSKMILFPKDDDGKMFEPVLTIETSAIGVPVKTKKFKMKFRTDNLGSPAQLQEM